MRTLFVVIAFMISIFSHAQNYSSLWKQEAEAEKSDLPRSQYEILMKIATKASADHNYGQLLKAELKGAKVMAEISPDSLSPAVERMKDRIAAEKDEVSRTVMQTVVWRICKDNPSLEMTPEKPELTPDLVAKLGQVKAKELSPIVINKPDSRIFDDDLLSVIGYQTEDYATLHKYYEQNGNRPAALMTALAMLEQEAPAGRYKLGEAKHLQRLDSLITLYADLEEAGEAAIARYEYMNFHTDATPKEQWQYTEMALQRWGGWQRMNLLRNAQRNLTASQLNMQGETTVVIPGEQQMLKMKDLRNISQLTLRIYKVKVDGNTELDPQSNENYKKLKPLLTPLSEKTIQRQYTGHENYELFEDSIAIGPLPVGVYMLEAETMPETSVERRLYFVSDVRVISQGLPEKTYRLAAVSATTGQPLPGAQIEVKVREGYSSNYKTQKLTADKQGEVLLTLNNNDRIVHIWGYTADDKACPVNREPGSFNFHEAQKEREHTVIFTDRAIYRPGQTLHAAAMVYLFHDGCKHDAVVGKTLTLTLRDANWKVVEEKTVTTDRYGTVSADFTLPSNGLTGRMTLQTEDCSQSFRVEEYKRPTFEVTFPEVKQSYADGDTLTVKATARSYSGVPVQGAEVSYKVMRRRALWWWSYSSYWNEGRIGVSTGDEEVFSGEAVTAQDGTFEVQMPMVLPKTDYPMFYNFIVTADVTDQAGETHQGQLSLPLGNRKTALTCDLNEKVMRESPWTLTFHLRNAAGVDLSADVRYYFERRLKNADGTFKYVRSGRELTAPAGEDIQLASLMASKSDPLYHSGRYRLTALCEGDTLKQEFTVFSLDDRQPADQSDDWFVLSAYNFPDDGKPITLQVGSSAENVYILYSVISGNKVLKSGTERLSNELINRKLTYKEEYGDELLITFAWMKQGHFYHHEARLFRPRPDKKLHLEWQTFRDRLLPGQQEEWSLRITKPDGTPADAQLMAVLYDKSLDQLATRSWHFMPLYTTSMAYTQWSSASLASFHLRGYRRLGHLNVNDLVFSHFDHDAFPSMWMGMRLRGSGKSLGRVMMAKSAMNMDDAAAPQARLEEVAVTSVDESLQGRIAGLDIVSNAGDLGSGQRTGSLETVVMPEVQLRENLQETAFFYPQLTTDADGVVRLTFTLPESLTTWQFQSIAHTADLFYGALEGETVAKKDVMIQPNMPRFVRDGDQATLSARIFNTSEKAVNGTAWLTLTNPETERIVLQLQQPFSVGADSTGAVAFNVDASTLADTPLLICKMMVSGDSFSDGEQHYLPVLPRLERVTVTRPFTQNGPGVTTIDLTKLGIPQVSNLKSTLDEQGGTQDNSKFKIQNSKLTVEYTANPVWFMIQALPAIGHPYDDCAVCQATSLYANAIGRHIISQVPNAKTIFEQWQRESQRAGEQESSGMKGSDTTLQSQLEKNQELKDLVLSETPWVADANREDEQRQRLADFFDPNTMDMRQQSALDKLKKLQHSDGSWSWWPDMPGSLYMTVNIAQMMVRLSEELRVKNEASSLLDKAFKYIGNEMVELVDQMKRNEAKGIKPMFPSFTALEWLYICALDGRKLPAKVEEANKYLIRLLKKDRKNQTIYEKAMTAIILNSTEYIQSLKEYTVYREDMGRYYDTPRAGYSWRDYRIPTQVAAIEALQRLTPNDQQTINEMRRWLLQQKRTQAWDTPLNSVDAVYAFLCDQGTVNSDLFAPAAPATLKFDSKIIETPKATAGIGYVKTAQPYAGEKTFTAEKTSEGTSWGAVYAQFMQPATDIADTGSGITVKREILVSEESGPSLKVGSRITVRITIENDRDLDFVQVQDKRAACMEPVSQLSGYRYGYYTAPHDNRTDFFFDRLPKGKHVIETQYYIDRPGIYQTGTCTAQCAYAPEFRATAKAMTLKVEE